MAIDLAVITIHGMGDQGPRYAYPLIKNLKSRLGSAKECVLFSSIYYQGVLSFNQDTVIAKMMDEGDFGWWWPPVREFLLCAFSDATSIESKKEIGNSTYFKVQKKIMETLDDVYDQLFPQQKEVPVVIIADSLGGQVISNYLWDAGWNPKHEQCANVGIWKESGDIGGKSGSTKDLFRRLRSVRALITSGCNIPIFVAGHDEIVAIKPYDDDFKWLNYYDRDDVLGWPLAPLSHSYGKLVKDYQINVGDSIVSMTPLSHKHYWQDRDFLRPVTDVLLELIKDGTSP